MRVAICVLLPLFLLACSGQEDVVEKTFQNKDAEVQINVCTRGCYQYLLEVDNTLYFVNYLQEEFQEDGLLVKFSGHLTDNRVYINSPSPNDGSIPQMMVSEVTISQIVKR